MDQLGIFIPFCHFSNWGTKSCGSKGTSTILDTAVFMKNLYKHYYIVKLFCKRLLYFHIQIKDSNIKWIWIKLAIKGAIKKDGCRNFRISENRMAWRISVKFWISLIYTTPQSSYTTALKLEIGAKNVPPGCGGEADSMSPL